MMRSFGSRPDTHVIDEPFYASYLVTTGIDHPARPNEDIKRLQDKGVTVFAVRDDLEERGINIAKCLAVVELIRRNDIALLLDDYDQVWHW